MDRYVIAGNPVHHSQSPFIHARFAEQTGQPVAYDRLLCPLDAFAPTLRAFAEEGGAGCNITVPFKFEAFALAPRASGRAQLAEAANVLRFDTDGWFADNTDGIGLVRDIERNAGVSLAGRRVLLIGAGGASSGALGPLLSARPAELVVANRTVARAQILVDRHASLAAAGGTQLRATNLEGCGNAFDVVINASASRASAARRPGARAHHRHRPAHSGRPGQRRRTPGRPDDRSGRRPGGRHRDRGNHRRPAHARHRCARRGRRRRNRGDCRSHVVNMFKNNPALSIALAISLAVHAVLLTVRLVDPEGFNRFFEDTPLEVILVNARSNEAPTKAQAIAQANLAGGGEMAMGRATSPLPSAALTELGDAAEDARKQIDQMMETQQQMLAQVRRDLAALPQPDPRRDKGDPKARAQEDRRRQLLQMLAEIEKRINEENARPKKRFISPATREEV